MSLLSNPGQKNYLKINLDDSQLPESRRLEQVEALSVPTAEPAAQTGRTATPTLGQGLGHFLKKFFDKEKN